MFLRSYKLFLAATLVSSFAGAANVISEKDRLTGFAEHQNKFKQFDKAREQGERAYLEEEEQWEHQKNRDLADYKKNKKAILMPEDGPEAQADAAAKKRYEKEQEEARKSYAENKVVIEPLDRQALNLPSEARELGLESDRPRYDYKKRALYGASPRYGKVTPSYGSSSGSSSPSFSGSSSNFPPPPTFDDFGDGGYVPAPNMPDDFGDIPPPPPPPPPPFGDDFGGFGSGTDFPPPPPPPVFNEDSGDF